VTDRRTIQGYGLVWEVKQRIQHIGRGKDGRPVALWYPIPLDGVAYFVGLAMLIAITRHLPPVSLLAGRLPQLVAYLLIPVGFAVYLSKIEPHGRPAIWHLWALIRHHVTAKERCLGQPIRPAGQPAVINPQSVLTGPPTDGRMCPTVIDGPAVVRFREPVHAIPKGRRRTLVSPPGHNPGWPQVDRVTVADGEQLVIRP
jgi:conjugation transfer TcpE-like protein